MEWIERLNAAIQYIEKHINEKIDYDELAKIACCSSYHFQRMFSYMAGVTLAEYIRRRRMSLAAVDLQNGSRVIDISLKYGYESPTAFNRAFQGIHGIAPSQVKKEGITLKSFSPISFTISIKGDTEMNYRIESKKAFRIVGLAKPLHKEVEKNFEIVPRMWQEAAISGKIPKLLDIADDNFKAILGVSLCNSEGTWKYYIAVKSNEETVEDFEECVVDSYTWAVFPGSGTMPDSIQELEKRIVTEWLPSSGYEYANGPDIEVYLSADPQNAQYEVWIPVVRKED